MVLINRTQKQIDDFSDSQYREWMASLIPSITSPMKAIRIKCLDCQCGRKDQVKGCEDKECPLNPFRNGKNPFLKKILTDEQRKAIRDRFEKIRKNV